MGFSIDLSNGDFKSAGDELEGYLQQHNGFGDVYDPLAEAQGVIEETDPGMMFMNWLTGKTKQAREYLQQRELQQLNADQQLQLQANEMEYNSEVNRVARMREAGLNVNLLAGAAGSSVGTSHQSSVSSPNHATSSIPALASGLDSVMNSVESFSRVGQIKANERNLDADTILKGIKAGLMPLESDAQISLWNATADELISRSGLNKENADWISAQAQFFESTIDVRADILRQDLERAKADVSKILQETNNLKKQYENIEKEGHVLDAEAALIKAQTSTEEMKQELYAENAQLLDWQGDIEKLRYEQIRDVFNGLPYGCDWSQVAALYAKGDESSIKQADLMIQGLTQAYSSQYNQQIRSAADNYWKNLGMRAGNSMVDMLQYLPFMLMRGNYTPLPVSPYSGWSPTITGQ